MPKSHNKKRNVGIVYELLLRRVSECLVNEDTKSAQQTLDIISRRFKKGTELYKEFRLFRALAKSHVSDESIARSILEEAKAAARKTDLKALEKEKSDLIREMNYSLKDRNLYFRHIPDYKSLATIQVLLNDWREGAEADIHRMALYESKVVDYLLQEKATVDISSETDNNIDPLVVKIMSEKMNEKYGKRFDKDQREILKVYAFASSAQTKESHRKLAETMQAISKKALTAISHLRETSDNKVIQEKIASVENRIMQESTRDIDDKKIVRFLTLMDLCKEIKESQNV